jgi:predicted nucleic acid-binding protein
MEKNNPGIKAICDAGPLIHLDELGGLVLLSNFTKIIIPEVVWEEVFRNRPSALNYSKLTKQKVHSFDDIEYKSIVCTFSLDKGEQAALALMRYEPGAIFLTDDSAARLAAVQMGMKVHGTIGILIRAIRQGQKTPEEIVELLQSIPKKSTLHIRTDLLSSIINRVKLEMGLL